MDMLDFILVLLIVVTTVITGLIIYDQCHERETQDDYSFTDVDNNEGMADYCYMMKNGGMVCEKNSRTFSVKEYTRL